MQVEQDLMSTQHELTLKHLGKVLPKIFTEMNNMDLKVASDNFV